VPDRSTIKGKRDYCILALLVGCALRCSELAALKIEDIQLAPASTSLNKSPHYLLDFAHLFF